MTILLCESCDHGYNPASPYCPWCGAPSHVAHTSNVTSRLDTECYIDYWLAKFDTGEYFEMFPGQTLDIAGLRQALSKYTVVSFNGIGYDLPIIALALVGADNATLKYATDLIITQGVKSWELMKMYKLPDMDWLDHIDMIEVAPGQSSLKAYGGKMHSQKLQDLPIEPSANIRWCDRVMLRQYCDNDLRTTAELHTMFKSQLTLREEMGKEHGLDLRSKSDAQIAEAIMKQLLPFQVQRPHIEPGTSFYYRPPEWLKFVNLDLVERITAYPFFVTPSGGVSAHPDQTLIDWGDDQVRYDGRGGWLKRPKGFAVENVLIGNGVYAFGTGGLHSRESKVHHLANTLSVLQDWDVASYYPSLILGTGIHPKQIGPVFSEIYRTWFDTRLTAKRAGDKKTANSLKIVLNGTFGKLGSKYSIFYDPAGLIQVTITGQLALLMLIEMMELSCITVVSANTDGIVLKFGPNQQWLIDATIKWWETVTGFEMERTDYSAVYSRDVNSYIAVKTDGEVKLKGAFAPPDPGPSGWPNPTGQICVTAMVEYLTNGTPLEQTIRGCTDIREFVYVRQVNGGGVLNLRPTIPKKASKKRMRELIDQYGCPIVDELLGKSLDQQYDELVAWSQAQTEYLGKIVRWYYATGSLAHIQYKVSGNMVPRTTGCAPLMELPDELPTNIDYQWYVDEARSLLADVGID